MYKIKNPISKISKIISYLLLYFYIIYDINVAIKISFAFVNVCESLS